MAWELALVWSETADVLKQESCWAVINQTKTVANCARMARRRKAYETAMKVFLGLLGFVASSPKVTEIPPNQKNRTEVLCRKS